MAEPRWLEKGVLLMLHAESLAEHGGLEGMRDEGLLESALARPLHIYHYENERDIVTLACAYAYGLLRNHPFADGNKRAGWIALRLFLALNGVRLAVNKVEAVQTVFAAAAGDMEEAEFTQWVTRRATII